MQNALGLVLCFVHQSVMIESVKLMKFRALLTAFIIGTAFFIFAVLLVGANLSGRKH